MSISPNDLPISPSVVAGVITPPINDREFRPETEPERKRKALLKELDDSHSLIVRLEKKYAGLRREILALNLA